MAGIGAADPPRDPPRAAKVAILGGGCAGLTTAFELSRPIHRGHYHVTVYQQGWRLGGKGASGRGRAGRIEEHGLHIWLGFYENAFRMVREAYAELAAHPLGSPFGDWRDAFLPEPDIGLFAPDGPDGWQLWRGRFPPRPGLPGDRDPPAPANPMADYVAGALAMLRTLLLDTVAAPPRDTPPDEDWPAAVTRLLDRGLMVGATAIAQALALIGIGLRAVTDGRQDAALLGLAEGTAAALRDWIERRFLADHPDAHVWQVAELVMASLVGTIRHGLAGHPEGLDSLDDWDCRDWLRANGASERAVRSPFVQGLYDLALAYEDGDPERPRIAAGASLRGTVRMFFGYRGALFWRMRAGMGDVVFAPLYECLRRRGVEFRFFHRLTDVGLSDDRDHVATLRFDVQARTAGDYHPLHTVAGRPCWPAQPRWTEVADGRALEAAGVDFESFGCRHRTGEIQLQVGRDFDFVVLAVGVGAVPHVAGAIVDHNPRWREMTRRVKTVATQAFQLWLKDDLAALGWRTEALLASAFPKPFDTWCDMAHVVPDEGWGEAGLKPPATVVYFCGVLADEAAPGADAARDWERRQQDGVRSEALRFLEGPAARLWPGLHAAEAFDWRRVAGDTIGPAGEGFYWRANVAPSERYTLTLPGATRWRISPLDLDYDNLTVAGDWTACGLNTGCSESAVMSGLLAAHALSGSPRLSAISGYDHP